MCQILYASICGVYASSIEIADFVYAVPDLDTPFQNFDCTSELRSRTLACPRTLLVPSKSTTRARSLRPDSRLHHGSLSYSSLEARLNGRAIDSVRLSELSDILKCQQLSLDLGLYASFRQCRTSAAASLQLSLCILDATDRADSVPTQLASDE